MVLMIMVTTTKQASLTQVVVPILLVNDYDDDDDDDDDDHHHHQHHPHDDDGNLGGPMYPKLPDCSLQSPPLNLPTHSQAVKVHTTDLDQNDQFTSNLILILGSICLKRNVFRNS